MLLTFSRLLSCLKVFFAAPCPRVHVKFDPTTQCSQIQNFTKFEKSFQPCGSKILMIYLLIFALPLKILLPLSSVLEKNCPKYRWCGRDRGEPSNLKNEGHIFLCSWHFLCQFLIISYKSGNFCLGVPPKAPFYWKLLKIGIL